MINLLPENSKRDILAARSNVTLLNYLVILGFGVIFLGLICSGVYFILMGSQADAERLIAVSKNKNSSYAAVQEQASTLRSGLSSAKTILDQEVAYTKILTGIAALMPAGVVLDGLTLSPTTFDAPITMQFYTKTTEDALKLKDNFQTSSLFSNVSFQSLSNANAQSGEYPINAKLNITINKSASR